MGRRSKVSARSTAVLGSLLLLAGCDGFFDVENITFIDASELDPGGDVRTLSESARQTLAVVYGDLIIHSAWFVGEAVSAETQAERIAFARRDVSEANAQLDVLWGPLSQARAAAQDVERLVAGGGDARTSVDRARAALVAGYSFLFMGEMFCQAAVNGGPPLSPAMVLDSATTWFSLAGDVARAAAAAGGAGATEAEQLASAALVGRARAHLQSGRKTQAALDAGAVPPGLRYELLYSSDLGSRSRTGNRVWGSTAGGSRNVLGVAPPFRVLDDPRLTVLPPSDARKPLDGVTEYWTQAKYPGFDAPILLASSMEAEYILAEATGAAAMLALVQARRAANGQPAYAGPVDEASVLAELMNQRGRDFYLEGKGMGDARRNPGAVTYQPAPGTPYPRAGFDPVGEQSCWPLPVSETRNNPHFR